MSTNVPEGMPEVFGRGRDTELFKGSRTTQSVTCENIANLYQWIRKTHGRSIALSLHALSVFKVLPQARPFTNFLAKA